MDNPPPPAPLGLEEEPHCVICDETTNLTEPALPCGHWFCREHLIQAFQIVIADESAHPARCCEPIPLDFRRHLPPPVLRRLEAREEEYRTLDRTYCSNIRCGKFIIPARISDGVGRCDECRKMTCCRCKQKAHQGKVCDEKVGMDEPTKKTVEYLQQTGGKQCPRCKTGIQHGGGCNEMRCKCGYQFCYACNAKWKSCQCKQWAEENLAEWFRDHPEDGPGHLLDEILAAHLIPGRPNFPEPARRRLAEEIRAYMRARARGVAEEDIAPRPEAGQRAAELRDLHQNNDVEGTRQFLDRHRVESRAILGQIRALQERLDRPATGDNDIQVREGQGRQERETEESRARALRDENDTLNRNGRVPVPPEGTTTLRGFLGRLGRLGPNSRRATPPIPPATPNPDSNPRFPRGPRVQAPSSDSNLERSPRLGPNLNLPATQDHGQRQRKRRTEETENGRRDVNHHRTPEITEADAVIAREIARTAGIEQEALLADATSNAPAAIALNLGPRIPGSVRTGRRNAFSNHFPHQNLISSALRGGRPSRERVQDRIAADSQAQASNTTRPTTVRPATGRNPALPRSTTTRNTTQGLSANPAQDALVVRTNNAATDEATSINGSAQVQNQGLMPNEHEIRAEILNNINRRIYIPGTRTPGVRPPRPLSELFPEHRAAFLALENRLFGPASQPNESVEPASQPSEPTGPVNSSEGSNRSPQVGRDRSNAVDLARSSNGRFRSSAALPTASNGTAASNVKPEAAQPSSAQVQQEATQPQPSRRPNVVTRATQMFSSGPTMTGNPAWVPPSVTQRWDPATRTFVHGPHPGEQTGGIRTTRTITRLSPRSGAAALRAGNTTIIRGIRNPGSQNTTATSSAIDNQDRDVEDIDLGQYNEYLNESQPSMTTPTTPNSRRRNNSPQPSIGFSPIRQDMSNYPPLEPTRPLDQIIQLRNVESSEAEATDDVAANNQLSSPQTSLNPLGLGRNPSSPRSSGPQDSSPLRISRRARTRVSPQHPRNQRTSAISPSVQRPRQQQTMSAPVTPERPQRHQPRGSIWIDPRRAPSRIRDKQLTPQPPTPAAPDQPANLDVPWLDRQREFEERQMSEREARSTAMEAWLAQTRELMDQNAMEREPEEPEAGDMDEGNGESMNTEP